jgi:hypothetical protein
MEKNRPNRGLAQLAAAVAVALVASQPETAVRNLLMSSKLLTRHIIMNPGTGSTIAISAAAFVCI